MTSQKLTAGSEYPALTVPQLGGGTLALGTPADDHDWQLVVVYRGKHCPMCTNYLKELNALLAEFNALGIEVVAVSADTAEKAADHMASVRPDFRLGYDMTIEQMHQLGLYVSHPRSDQETDRPFAEPGIFVINASGKLQVTDISNAPFARPDLKTLLSGLRFIRTPENNYPIRGTLPA